jgi:integrase/recombinase XerC
MSGGRTPGIALRVHPHLLRHSYASELLEDGASLVEVKQLLGHERE